MKPLVNPLAWYLLFQLVGLIALRRRRADAQRLIAALIALTMVMAILGSPLIGAQIARALRLDSRYGDTAPQVIFVLAGGYLAGATSDEDLLGSETEMRVVRGVSEWKRHPEARVVFSGANPDLGGARRADRMAQLMAEAALRRGLPSDRAVIESRSINTWEHPIEALKLADISPETPIMIVTDAWHMRRARREFCRHFSNVAISAPVITTAPWSWTDFVPTTGALGGNTTLLRELAGIGWYALRGLTGPAAKC